MRRPYPDDYSKMSVPLVNKAVVVLFAVVALGLVVLMWIYSIGS